MLKMKQKCISLCAVLMFTLTVIVTGQTCDFEYDLCGWENGSWADGPWTRGSLPVSSFTGPQSANTGNYYVYMNARDYRHPVTRIVQEGKKAVIVSPILSTNSSSLCFFFYYYMYGASVSKLTVGTVDENETNKQEKFQKTGNQGEKWFCSEFTVSTTSRKRIYIEAITGANIQSNIAIDDLAVIPSSCGAGRGCLIKKANITNDESISSTTVSTTSNTNITTQSFEAGKTDNTQINENMLLFAILIPVGLLIIIAILAVICYNKSKKKEVLNTHDFTVRQNPLYNIPEDPVRGAQNYSYLNDYDYPYHTEDTHPPPLPNLASRM